MVNRGGRAAKANEHALLVANVRSLRVVAGRMDCTDPVACFVNAAAIYPRLDADEERAAVDQLFRRFSASDQPAFRPQWESGA